MSRHPDESRDPGKNILFLLYFLSKKYENDLGGPKLAIDQVHMISIFIPLKQLLP
jgi:hypothetical protein